MITDFKPRIGISIGDYNGIGPEIILKALNAIDFNISTPVIFAPKQILEYYWGLPDLQPVEWSFLDPESRIKPGTVNLFWNGSSEVEVSPGDQTAEAGKLSIESINTALRWAMENRTHAMVTAPISKEAVNLAGYKIPGHTEHLAANTNTDTVLMMLVNESLRVALATTHVPVKDIHLHLSHESISQRLHILNRSLKDDFGIEEPEIAVLGLNPHAGDGGVIGMEEIDLIIPTLKALKSTDMNLSGPFPADAFFGRKLHEQYDAVFAMYHDQGLAPFKLLSFGKGVNFSAGLPVIRTSPDHGTAYNIAGKGMANPSSFIQAYNLAVKLASKKHS